MGLEDFGENRNRSQRNNMKRNYHGFSRETHDSGYPYHKYKNDFSLMQILIRIKNNRKLKLLIFFTVILLLAVLITLIIVLMPLFMKLIHYISQNGLQGLLDYFTNLVDKIWNGVLK
ncbi:MAG: hypothetical protein FD166_908 [Bacteroidetes bacterium]|nr:MAG: hypothetical protein FD166_908 [Bacteroidota bacterium]